MYGPLNVKFENQQSIALWKCQEVKFENQDSIALWKCQENGAMRKIPNLLINVEFEFGCRLK
jgi:hypothetical protein